jgi:hypothetical protein
MESEFSTVADFVAYISDDDRDTFTGAELQKLREGMSLPLGMTHKLRLELEELGLTLAAAPRTKSIRTLGGSNDHDRWYGPGSSPTHGGSGWENIVHMIR